MKTEELNYIKVIDGRWHLNMRPFEELTLNERFTLAERIKQL